ncbi:MAG: leucine-rich repeat domain-containing protein [Candidatus Helarchaeota archaeon]
MQAEGNHIVRLGLYACGLTALPESFGQLKSLQELWIYENQLTTLPESFLHLSNLKMLYIEGNPFDSTANAVLKELKERNVSIYI